MNPLFVMTLTHETEYNKHFIGVIEYQVKKFNNLLKILGGITNDLNIGLV